MKNYKEMTVPELVALLKIKNEDAFTELYNKYYKHVYYTCYQFMKNEEDANDIMQDVFISVYNNIDSLKNNEAFSSWIGVITSNKCKNALVKSNKWELYTSYDSENDSDEFEFIDDNSSKYPEDVIINDETKIDFLNIIHKLPISQYRAVFLYYYEELPISEISKIESCSEGTIKSRLFLGRKAIEHEILQYEKKKNVKLHCSAALLILLLFNFDEVKVYASSTIVDSSYTNIKKTINSDNSGKVNQNIPKAQALSQGVKHFIIVGCSLAVITVIIVVIVLINSKSDSSSDNISQTTLSVETSTQLVENDVETTSNSIEGEKSDDSFTYAQLVGESSDLQIEGVNINDSSLQCASILNSGFIVASVNQEATDYTLETYYYGAINCNGEQIVPVEYDGVLFEGTSDGHFALYKVKDDYNKDIYIFDKTGNIVFKTDEIVCGYSDGILVTKKQIDSEYNELVNIQITYQRLDGTIIYQTTRYNTNIEYCYVSPFIDGNSMIVNSNKEYKQELFDICNYLIQYDIVDESGNSSTKYSEPVPEIVEEETETEISDDVISCNGGDFEYDMRRDFSIQQNGWICYYLDAMNDIYLSKDGFVYCFDAMATLKPYYIDYSTLYNYGDYVVITYGEKQYLIKITDALDVFDESNPSTNVYTERAVAEYDFIGINTNKYWLVEDGNNWGYIDHDGKLINMYDDASAFINGYAMVIKNGQAYVINENFQIVSAGISADGVCVEGNYGFRVTIGDKYVYIALPQSE